MLFLGQYEALKAVGLLIILFLSDSAPSSECKCPLLISDCYCLLTAFCSSASHQESFLRADIYIALCKTGL